MLAKLEQAKLLLAECQTIGEAKVAMDIGTNLCRNAGMARWPPRILPDIQHAHGIRADRFVK